jgi:hypothetical protein
VQPPAYEEVRVYEIPADKHLSIEQIRRRVDDEILLYRAYGDEVALDLIRGHLRWMRRKMETYAVLALVIAYLRVNS